MEKYDLIIFDLDGTLYDLKDLVEFGFELSIGYLLDIQKYKKEDAIKLLYDNNIYPFISEKAKSTTQLFASLGFDINKWNEYRSSRFAYQLIKKENATNNEVLTKLKSHSKIVLLTNNTKENVDNILRQIDINPNIFDSIHLNNKNVVDLSKQKLMEDIIKEYSVSKNKVLSIGDRYNVDALPLLNIGGESLIISNPHALELILKDYPNFKNCDEYKYYK